MKRKVTSKVNVDLKDYVNDNTGETLLSELTNNKSKLYVEQDLNKFTIQHDNYVIIDSEAITYLIKNLSFGDCTKTLALSKTLKTELNVAYDDNNYPHTLDTLSRYLNISKDEVTKLVKRLYKKSVFGKFSVYINDTEHVYYIMNPHIASKRKVFCNTLLKFFPELKG